MRKNENYGSHGADKPARSAKTERFNDIRFVNYQLPPDVKAALKEKPFTSEQFADALLDLLDAGYTTKFKYDAFIGGYQVFVQATDPKHVNAGMILPGRGSTPAKALKQACFLHYEVMQGAWEGFLENRPTDLDD